MCHIGLTYNWQVMYWFVLTLVDDKILHGQKYIDRLSVAQLPHFCFSLIVKENIQKEL